MCNLLEAYIIYISKGLLKSTSEYGTEIGFGWPSGCNQLQLYINLQPSKRNILFLQTYYIVRDLTHDWDVKVKTGLHTTVVDKIMESIVARIFFSGFLTRSATNQAVQPQKMARALKCATQKLLLRQLKHRR